MDVLTSKDVPLTIVQFDMTKFRPDTQLRVLWVHDLHVAISCRLRKCRYDAGGKGGVKGKWRRL